MTRQESPRTPLRWAAIASVALVLTGCDGLLEVELPGDMSQGDVVVPNMATVMVNSAIADFECAFSMYSVQIAGAEDSRAQTSGYWQGYVRYNALRPGGGRCSQNAPTGTNWFQSMQASRLMAETAHQAVSEWSAAEVPNASQLLATAATYLGLYYTHFGETYCEFAPGAEAELHTPTQMLQEGEQWFTTALGHLGSGDLSIISTSSLRQLALLGRARARLAKGDHQGAAADAALIQPGFSAWATRDGSVRGRWNQVYEGMSVQRWGSISAPIYWLGHDDDLLVSVGYQNLTISPDGRHTVGDGVPDPRVPTQYTGQFAQDGETDQWNQTKYTAHSDPQRIAGWSEAQLILAEIAGGQAAVDRINAVRDVYHLPHFASTDEDEIYSAIIEERRREFFYEGRHFADKLRYGLWFPRGEGWNHKAQRYEHVTCLLMPESGYELNPNIPAGYEGPDTTDPNYRFELQVDREVELGVHWPVPATLD